MFVIFRKKTLIFALVFAAAVALGAIMLTVSPMAEASVPKIGKTIVLDAGHGGVDGGVVGTSGKVKEAEINLAIVKSLKHFLVRNGYDVVLTRSDADGLYGNAKGNLKRADMQKRREIIESSAPDLVVSVHQNYYPLSSVRGAQVFYAADNEHSQSFAETIQATLNSALGQDKVAKPGDYYIVECTDYPSVIVECGFLSNAEEERLLASGEYQEKIAYTLFTAIHSICGEHSDHPEQ